MSSLLSRWLTVGRDRVTALDDKDVPVGAYLNGPRWWDDGRREILRFFSSPESRACDYDSSSVMIADGGKSVPSLNLGPSGNDIAQSSSAGHAAISNSDQDAEVGEDYYSSPDRPHVQRGAIGEQQVSFQLHRDPKDVYLNESMIPSPPPRNSTHRDGLQIIDRGDDPESALPSSVCPSTANSEPLDYLEQVENLPQGFTIDPPSSPPVAPSDRNALLGEVYGRLDLAEFRDGSDPALAKITSAPSFTVPATSEHLPPTVLETHHASNQTHEHQQILPLTPRLSTPENPNLVSQDGPPSLSPHAQIISGMFPPFPYSNDAAGSHVEEVKDRLVFSQPADRTGDMSCLEGPDTESRVLSSALGFRQMESELQLPAFEEQAQSRLVSGTFTNDKADDRGAEDGQLSYRGLKQSETADELPDSSNADTTTFNHSLPVAALYANTVTEEGPTDTTNILHFDDALPSRIQDAVQTGKFSTQLRTKRKGATLTGSELPPTKKQDRRDSDHIAPNAITPHSSEIEDDDMSIEHLAQPEQTSAVAPQPEPILAVQSHKGRSKRTSSADTARSASSRGGITKVRGRDKSRARGNGSDRDHKDARSAFDAASKGETPSPAPLSSPEVGITPTLDGKPLVTSATIAISTRVPVGSAPPSVSRTSPEVRISPTLNGLPLPEVTTPPKSGLVFSATAANGRRLVPYSSSPPSEPEVSAAATPTPSISAASPDASMAQQNVSERQAWAQFSNWRGVSNRELASLAPNDGWNSAPADVTSTYPLIPPSSSLPPLTTRSMSVSELLTNSSMNMPRPPPQVSQQNVTSSEQVVNRISATATMPTMSPASTRPTTGLPPSEADPADQPIAMAPLQPPTGRSRVRGSLSLRELTSLAPYKGYDKAPAEVSARAAASSSVRDAPLGSWRLDTDTAETIPSNTGRSAGMETAPTTIRGSRPSSASSLSSLASAKSGFASGLEGMDVGQPQPLNKRKASMGPPLSRSVSPVKRDINTRASRARSLRSDHDDEEDDEMPLIKRSKKASTLAPSAVTSTPMQNLAKSSKIVKLKVTPKSTRTSSRTAKPGPTESPFFLPSATSITKGLPQKRGWETRKRRKEEEQASIAAARNKKVVNTGIAGRKETGNGDDNEEDELASSTPVPLTSKSRKPKVKEKSTPESRAQTAAATATRVASAKAKVTTGKANRFLAELGISSPVEDPSPLRTRHGKSSTTTAGSDPRGKTGVGKTGASKIGGSKTGVSKAGVGKTGASKPSASKTNADAISTATEGSAGNSATRGAKPSAAAPRPKPAPFVNSAVERRNRDRAKNKES